MIGITLVRKRYINLEGFASDEAPKMMSRVVNILSEDFAKYVQENKLSGQVLNVVSGETRGSVGFYQVKAGAGRFGLKYVVRPGKGVPGHLNYLVGMGRGMMVSVRGKAYTVRARPFMQPGWSEYRASGKPKQIKDAVLASYLAHAAQRAPTTETIGGTA